MKRIFIALLWAVCVAPVWGGTPLTAQQKQEVIRNINRAAAEVKSIGCSFSQTKHLSLLNNQLEAKGKFYYKQPDKLRWEYTSPYQYLFILNGSKVYTANNTRQDVIDTNSNKVFKEIARMMLNSVTGKALSSSSDFEIDVVDEQTKWQVLLTPKKKEVKSFFSKIELYFSKSTLVIAEISIYEKNKNRTHMSFHQIATNQPLDETLFSLTR